jgi:enoyl-CoA hydratase/carnithine racemase
MTEPEGRGATAVTTTRDGAVALVTLTRPARANALDGEITDALLDAVRRVRDDDGVRAMVLTGAGRSFSAGGDVATIEAMQDKSVRAAMLGAHTELFWEMIRLPCPSVAAVNGPAVGAGVTVALLCDLVVMAPGAFLSDPRVALGLLDGAGGMLLWPLLTSLSAAREHLLLGDRVTAAEAHRLGLANRVAAGPEVLDESMRLAHRLAKLPRQAAAQARRLLNYPVEQAAALLDASSRAESELFDTPEHRALVEQLSRRVAAGPPAEQR